jgi:hypothetical protein
MLLYWILFHISLDNGELIWGMYALANALRDAGEPALATRYQNYLSMMTTNLKMMFYQPDKHAYAAEVWYSLLQAVNAHVLTSALISRLFNRFIFTTYRLNHFLETTRPMIPTTI